MQIEENRAGSGAAVTAYEPGRIEIDGRAYGRAVFVCGGTVGHPGQASPSELAAGDFFQTACGGEMPEVVLVGTGEKQVFLHPKTVAGLAQRGIGVECMPTASACRTFMVLQSEGRRVWAWLWP